MSGGRRRRSISSGSRTQDSFAPTPPRFKNSLGMEFVLVSKGKFRMGCGEQREKEVEIPHAVGTPQWHPLARGPSSRRWPRQVRARREPPKKMVKLYTSSAKAENHAAVTVLSASQDTFRFTKECP